jgi:squalene-associated FAD-dependent desaturase
MTQGKVHVIGAGLAGLSAAVRIAGEGVGVELSESAANAGGRCRSYFDPQLGLTIDNGNHLVLSGNKAVISYLARIGAEDRLAGPDKAEFDWIDLRDGARWTLRPNEGPIPWWVLSKDRRVPGTHAADYVGIAALMNPKPGQRVDQVLKCEGPLWERLLQPFLLSALNTEPKSGAADLAAAIIRETLAKGGRAYLPRIAEPTLAAAFVEPALDVLAERGAQVRTGRRLRSLAFDGDRVTTLTFPDGEVAVAKGESVVLAVPPWVASELVPDITVPDEFCAIINAHFRIDLPAGTPPMIGVIGGTAEWIFVFEDRVSVTVSAGDRLVDMDREALAALLWRDIAAVHGLGPEMPPWQIVKEKRATFAATPEQNAKRPSAETRWSNLFLAGDWVQTGLPATIEGSLRSGEHAAGLALQHRLV